MGLEIADVTGDFVYARLQKGEDGNPHCYPEAGLKEWAEKLKLWSKGGAPDDLPLLAGDAPEAKPRAEAACWCRWWWALR